MGDKFDPNIHDALFQLVNEDLEVVCAWVGECWGGVGGYMCVRVRVRVRVCVCVYFHDPRTSTHK